VLVDGWKLTAQGRGLTCFDKWRGAEVDVADAGEYADGRDDGCAQKADDNDFQMRATIDVIHRVIHDIFPFLPLTAVCGQYDCVYLHR
jgi:hypothetical protein